MVGKGDEIVAQIGRSQSDASDEFQGNGLARAGLRRPPFPWPWLDVRRLVGHRLAASYLRSVSPIRDALR
jgi:hypothetical protein